MELCDFDVRDPGETTIKHGRPRFVDSSKHVFYFFENVEKCLLSNKISDYYFVSQGKTTIPGLDDGEEMLITDVSARSPSTKSASVFFGLINHAPLMI